MGNHCQKLKQDSTSTLAWKLCKLHSYHNKTESNFSVVLVTITLLKDCNLTKLLAELKIITKLNKKIQEAKTITIDHFTWGLATAIYVAMVTPILYDNSYSLNDSNLKYESYWPYG